jgi:salicylate hydroxylase
MACGAASAKLSSATGKPRVSGHIAYRAVLKREDVPAHLWSDDVSALGWREDPSRALPAAKGRAVQPGGRLHSNKYDEGWNTFGDTAELNERFAHAVPQVRELLAKIETWKMWVLVRPRAREELDGPPRHFAGGRGPSHAAVPGPGAGQAIEDAGRAW